MKTTCWRIRIPCCGDIVERSTWAEIIKHIDIGQIPYRVDNDIVEPFEKSYSRVMGKTVAQLRRENY